MSTVSQFRLLTGRRRTVKTVTYTGLIALLIIFNLYSINYLFRALRVIPLSTGENSSQHKRVHWNGDNSDYQLGKNRSLGVRTSYSVGAESDSEKKKVRSCTLISYVRYNYEE